MGQRGVQGGHDIILVGGSSGSLVPLRAILAALPSALPSAVFVVLHLARHQRSPTVVIEGHSSLEVSIAEDGEPFLPGRVYMAPGDRHRALEDGKMRVFHGARENGSRPAIDVLFRSAAVHHGARVAGVLLSGVLRDGSMGLSAVEERLRELEEHAEAARGAIAAVSRPFDAEPS